MNQMISVLVIGGVIFGWGGVVLGHILSLIEMTPVISWLFLTLSGSPCNDISLKILTHVRLGAQWSASVPVRAICTPLSRIKSHTLSPLVAKLFLK